MPHNIFVLDDHPDTTELLEVTLTSHGFSVKASTDPNAVLDDLKGQLDRPCIIFLDHSLNGLRAAEFKQQVEQINPPVHFVLITGYDAAQKAGELGIKHYLQKPFDPAEVVALAQQLIESCAASHPEIH
jgi:DNA-binding NtrC family response regulator